MSEDVLIERDRERAWLESALEEAIAGHGGLVLLDGEAGVGKTSLAEEVADPADALLLRGGPGLGAVAYGPIVAALRGYPRCVSSASRAGIRETRCTGRSRTRVRPSSAGPPACWCSSAATTSV